MAKSIKLNSTTDIPLLILGIISTNNILKLSWVLNHLLNIRLSQSLNLNLNYTKTNNILEFSLFQFEDENLHLKFSLLENRVKSFFYFDELRNIDYLFFIRGEFDIHFRDSTLLTLKKSSEIISLLSIDSEMLRQKGKLEHF